MGPLAAILIASSALCSQIPAPAKTDPLAVLRFLEGEWQGEGSGTPGNAVGAASFRFELSGSALVRRSYADIPANAGRPASRHEDLLVIHAQGEALKALYVDNEGHAIHYAVSALSGGEGIVFLSEDPGSRFRMTYRRTGSDMVAFSFEVAPPQKPEAFSKYLEAVTKRKVAPK